MLCEEAGKEGRALGVTGWNVGYDKERNETVRGKRERKEQEEREDKAKECNENVKKAG